jgi:hypothetical protein
MTRQNKSFLLSLLGLSLLYLGFEIFFNFYAMFATDEFWSAHLVYQYKNGLPYRDFAPYKTVLGYYLLLLPMLISHGVIQTLILIKNTLAVANTIILFGSALWLTRFFRKRAILTSLAMLITADMVLSYSTNIRVDLPGYWLGFFSLLFILEKRFWAAGLLLGLGFMVTQKTILYMVASNCALIVEGLFFSRNRQTLANIFKLNFTTAGMILLYIFFWSMVSDCHTVMHSIFYEAAILYHIDWYDSAKELFWSQILLKNTLLFLLWPLSWISIFVTYDADKTRQQRIFIVIYALVIVACLIHNKMIFPYYTQIVIPVFFILYAAVFTWLFGLFKAYPRIKSKRANSLVWAAAIVYMLAVINVIVAYHLPEIDLLICLIPFLLTLYLTHHDQALRPFLAIFFGLISTSVMLIIGTGSLLVIKRDIQASNGQYQKANIMLVDALLQDGSDYVSGIELIYNKTQAIAAMRHLIGPAIDYLSTPTAKLQSLMLASLYQDPDATAASVITALQKSTVKFYVNNYRMMALSSNIKNYLDSQYAHLWGSIYLYAPEVVPGHAELVLKYSGNYFVECDTAAPILIDGRSHSSQAILYLEKGVHLSSAGSIYRLKLLPENATLMRAQFQQENSDKMLE